MALALATAPAAAQAPPPAPAPAQPLSASPGSSGGEGGGFGKDVTLKPATKEEPFLSTVVGQPSGPPQGDTPAARCLRLAWTDFSLLEHAPTQVINASVTPATAEAPDICVINGYVAPYTMFRIHLPLSTWNGKYMQVGCGGRCGALQPLQCEVQVRRGYACLASDLGHRGTTYDNLWAIDNIQGEMDFGFRSTHTAALAGKAITAKYYGKPAQYAYFVGASTGGRQALVAAQRFPEDFDGIVSGEPAMGMPGALRGEGGIGIEYGKKLLVDGKPAITVEDIRMLHKAVMDRCDDDDGLKDGIITDPRVCDFQPSQIACRGDNSASCLSPAQVTAVAAAYGGGRGLQLGSELAWIGAYVAQDGTAGRYTLERNANKERSPYWFIFDDATNVDLRAFKASGGKFIFYTGWADEVINPLAPVTYYESVERVVGSRKETQDFFRFFAIPGQSHIPGNVGAESMNYVVALEDWVERGKAPDVLVGHKLKWITQMMGPMYLDKDLQPSNYLYSRPHYPYPIQARYRGGDPDQASSFGPWDPVAKRWVK
jgi:pimeloyl-ACP methyl ester carboxylesterase